MALKIGISGKRQILAAEKDQLREEIKATIHKILRENKTTDFIGYSAIASGADTLFASVVKEMNKPLRIILPFPSLEYEKDFTDPTDLETYKALTQNSTIEQVMQAEAPSGKEERDAAYFRTGKEIVDKCDEIIIVTDNLRPRGHGGTSEILGYTTEKKQKKTINIIEVKTAKEDRLHDEIIQEFETSNQIAIDTRNVYRRVWTIAILLGWLAVLCFSLYIGFHYKGLTELLFIAVELLLVSSVFILFSIARKKSYHIRYLRERLKAETLRLLLCYYHTGCEPAIFTEKTIKDTKTDHLVDAVQRKLQHSYQSKWYAQYAIKALIHEQQEYHRGKIRAIGKKPERLEMLTFLVGSAFLLNLLLHFATTLLHYFSPSTPFHYPHELSVFLNIILPASYAAIEALLYSNEWAALKKNSKNVNQHLKKSLAQLPSDIDQLSDKECYDKQVAVLNKISIIMLADNRDWHLIMEDKENYSLII